MKLAVCFALCLSLATCVPVNSNARSSDVETGMGENNKANVLFDSRKRDEAQGNTENQADLFFYQWEEDIANRKRDEAQGNTENQADVFSYDWADEAAKQKRDEAQDNTENQADIFFYDW